MLAISILLAGAFSTFAQDASKTIQKEFKVKEDAVLSVENKFGKIHCNVWDQNEITIEAQIKTTSKNKSDAERLLGKVSIEINGNSNRVEAITTIEDKINTNGESSITIDYTINMPRTLNLVLNNKFGDIYVDENSGSSLINLDYGNLQINKLQGDDHELNMRFSKGTLGKADKMKIALSYSELRADEIRELEADTKFSTLEVDESEIAVHESQYDTNILGELHSAKITAKFSTITISSVTDNLELEVRYGGCNVENIGPDFKTVNVDNSFGNVDLNFDPHSSFRVEAKSGFGRVVFPKNADIVEEETSFTSKSYTGSIGKGQSNRKVIISTRNGDVNLKMN